MALKRPQWGPGTLVLLEHESRILRGNALRDPHVRKLAVWLRRSTTRARSALPGASTGAQRLGLSQSLKNFSENVPSAGAAHLGAAHGADHHGVPDCFTALGATST